MSELFKFPTVAHLKRVYDAEQVLVAPSIIFADLGRGFTPCNDVNDWLQEEFCEFVHRRAVAHDNRFKQMTHYVIVTDGEQYLTIERWNEGREKRLGRQYSLGIGGHISDVNFCSFISLHIYLQYKVLDALHKTLHRLKYADVWDTKRLRFGGLLNSGNSTRIHQIGVVYLFKPPSLADLEEGGSGKLALRPMTLAALQDRRKSFDEWSRYLIQNLAVIV